MKRAVLIVAVLVFVIDTACTSRRREQELEKKQQQLNQKEQELLLREKTLQLREEELAKLKQAADSAAVADTTSRDTTARTDDASLAGLWQVKMTCVETTCPGSAVGDTKIEQWIIRYQDNHIIAEANVGDRLVRVYSGLASGNRLELIQHTDSTSSLTYDTRMVVRLRMAGKNLIEGEREIIRENSCKIVYALRLDKL